MNTLLSARSHLGDVSSYRYAGLFVLLAVLWGVSFPAIRVGLPYMPPVLFAAARYDVAGLCLLGYVAVARDVWLPASDGDVLAILAGGAFLVAGNGLVFVGEQFTTSGVAAVVFSLVPIFTSAFAWLLLVDRGYAPVQIAGVLVGLAGVWIVADPEPSNLLAAVSVVTGEAATDVMASEVYGMWLVLLAAALVALGSVLVDRAEPRLTTAPLTAWAMVAGGVILHGVSLAAGERPAAVEVTAEAVAAVGYLGLFASALAYLVYFDLLDRFGPLEVNLVSYAVPVVAAVGGWLLLDEQVTPSVVGGFLVILAGFALVKHRQLRDWDVLAG